MIGFKGGRLTAGGRRTGLGRGFGGAIRYLREGPRDAPDLDRVAHHGVRNLSVDMEHAGVVMRSTATGAPRCQQPVYHFGASLAPGESLSAEQWDAVADRLLGGLGLSEHEAVFAVHSDREHEHLHLVVNRVHPESLRAWSPKNDHYPIRTELRLLEQEHGLQVVANPGELGKSNVLSAAYQEAKRRSLAPHIERVRSEALEVFRGARSWKELEKGLAGVGLRLEAAERGGGVVVVSGGMRVSASRVDRHASGPKLARRFGSTFREYREENPKPPPLSKAGSAGGVALLSGETLSERAESLIERVSATSAVIRETDLHKAAFWEADASELITTAKASSSLVELSADARGVMQYTSLEYLRQERGLLGAAAALSERNEHALPHPEVDRVLEGVKGLRLSEEQREAALHATTGPDLALVVGRAGVGKTHLARGVAQAYEEAGYRVRGMALAGKAAEGLQEAGIPSRTIASYEHAWAKGRGRLGARDVLILDEAGMVDVPQLGRVLQEADFAKAKVVLLGDPDQLQPIGPGDAFRGLLEGLEAKSVDVIRRQQDAWQREASEALSLGRVPEALRSYEEHGRISWQVGPEEARRSLVRSYMADSVVDEVSKPGGAPEPPRGLLLAYRRADVADLNERVRSLRKEAGELRRGVQVKTESVGKIQMSPGDRILFGRNDHRGLEVETVRGASGGSGAGAIGVKNGTLGTVLEVSPGRLEVALDDRRVVAFDPRQYQDFQHGYAVTIHKAQGVTVDRAYVLADPLLDRNSTYVALTRHREQVTLAVDRQQMRSGDELAAVLGRAPKADLARDFGASRDMEEVRGLLAQLEQRESLYSERTVLQHERERLPHRGLVPDLERALAREISPEQRLVYHAERIHRRPQQASEALLAHAKRHGVERTLEVYSTEPERFGTLVGTKRLGRESAERVTARRVASVATREARSFFEHGLDLRRALPRAQAIQERLGAIAAAERSLPRQVVLEGRIGRLAVGLTPGQIRGQLPGKQVERVLSLVKDQRQILRPVEMLLARPGKAAAQQAARWLAMASPNLVGRLASHVRQGLKQMAKVLAPEQGRGLGL